MGKGRESRREQMGETDGIRLRERREKMWGSSVQSALEAET